ncbi:MAG: hypothetical protein ACPGVD_04615 [Flavobacteriales bacterium]
MYVVNFLFLICLASISCNQKIEKKEYPTPIPPKIESEEIPVVETREDEIQRYQSTAKLLDSNSFLALKKALDKAKKKIHLNNYYKKFLHKTSDSLYEIQVSISVKKVFGNKRKHLIIKRGVDEYYKVNIYSISGKEIIPVLKFELEDHTYMSDSIFDVNGDNLKDYVVNWYGASGCCPRYRNSVFISKKNGGFESEIDFINSTFYPKDKKILGMTYGHPGEVSLYKLKWKGVKIDTIEYINIDTSSNRETPFFKTKVDYWGQKDIEKIPLEKLPKEYENIGDGWFYEEL